MGKINLLSSSVSELIAAGEVVERPSSVVKETLENSIDAKAKHITLEIKRGGITYIRITDDGCGIEREDVPTAFLRHATSKIRTASDLDSINTLGFRGEALAAISAVSRVEVVTAAEGEPEGTHYCIEGGTELVNEPVGCATGTTIIVRDLFYNTPARMKFLKKDVSEGTAVSAVIERVALSHPEIAFKFIRDGKTVFTTTGSGKTGDAVYSVLGREFYSGLMELSSEENGVKVSGFICKPVFCRASRSHQFTFLNGRLVLSRTVMAAVEQAYKGSSMVGKFPSFVLFVNIPTNLVDVNVHPAKTEVRFADEKRVFSAVHYAVKNTISQKDTRPNISLQKKKDNFFKMTADSYRQTAVHLYDDLPKSEKPSLPVSNESAVFCEDKTPFFAREDVKRYVENHTENPVTVLPELTKNTQTKREEPKKREETAKTKEEYNPKTEIRFIGEAFSTYIIVERDETVYFIDKHAAHERIIYNELKSRGATASQVLLTPVTVKLDEKEYSALISNCDIMEKAGFEIEDFGTGTVLVRAVLSALDKEDIESVITEAAQSLLVSKKVEIDTLDNLFHSVACKAAIKAGYITSKEELWSLAVKVLSDKNVMYCPHGRPVAFELSKRELHKYFGRIQ